MPVLELHDNGTVCRIPFTTGRSVRDILDATTTRVRSGCNGSGACGMCKVRVEAGRVNEITTREEYFIDELQAGHGVRLACQLVADGDLTIRILSPAPRSTWRSLSPESVYDVRETVPGDISDGAETYGIAIDLGTTQISLSLLSLRSGRRLAGRCGRNPQGDSGTDVMTRLVSASGSSGQAAKIGGLAVRAIGEGIQDIANREGVDLNQVIHIAIVGNTAMLALLAGRNYELLVSPETWMGTIDCTPRDTTSWKAAWELPGTLTVDLLPPAGGFIGSDLLAGVLATGLMDSILPGLFIDFGTNTEIAFWDGRTLLVTSAAGGPAFEGCGIRCGIPAEPGAVCHVRLEGGVTTMETIPGKEPCGICGTGIIDFIAGLVRSEILNEKGQFAPAYAESGFVLAGGDPVLVIKKGDVDVFQRAKAAVGSGIQILMNEAGIRYPDLDRVYVGGTFGRSLDIVNAIDLGLLPPVPPDRIELCGNTALAGCELALRSPSASNRLREIGEQAQVINLADHRDFNDIYLENLFLRPLEGR